MNGSDTAVSTPHLWPFFPPCFRRFFALSGFLTTERTRQTLAENGRKMGEIVVPKHPILSYMGLHNRSSTPRCVKDLLCRGSYVYSSLDPSPQVTEHRLLRGELQRRERKRCTLPLLHWPAVAMMTRHDVAAKRMHSKDTDPHKKVIHPP